PQFVVIMFRGLPRAATWNPAMIELAIHPHKGLRRVGLALFVPLFTVVTIVTLLALLGVFVLWLAVVGALFGAIIMADLTHRSAWRRVPPTIALPSGPAA